MLKFRGCEMPEHTFICVIHRNAPTQDCQIAHGKAFLLRLN